MLHKAIAWFGGGCAAISIIAVITYFAVGLLTALFFTIAIGSPGPRFFVFLVVAWPVFWVMGFIFAAAALGAPH